MAYKVPFVGYKIQYLNLKKELDSAFQNIMSRGELILREDLRRFEKNIASFLKIKHAIGVHNGTDALYLSIPAAGIGPGDEVITVAHTFLATVAAIVKCGATPVLVDVGKDHNMDMNKVEEAITPKTKAVLPVHLNGRCCDMGRLMDIAHKHNLIIVEDAAQALGATYNGKKAGSFGILNCFSFYPAKMLGTAGDGGMITTSSEEMANLLRAWRDNGRVMGQDEVICFGYNTRLDNLHAALLEVKFKYLPQWITRRRAIAALYQKGLSALPQIELPPPPQDSSPYFDVYQNYVIRSKERDDLAVHLRENGVEIIISWPIPIHKQKALNLNHFRLPETESISREVISLPMYPELTDDEVEYVINTVHKFYK